MSENPRDLSKTLEDVKNNFKFLFDRGYVIDYANPINEYWMVWEVVLKRQGFCVKLEAERGGLDVSFGSPEHQTNIRALIYFLSKEKEFIGLGSGCFNIFRNNMEIEAKLLQKHIDRFESSLESEFPKSDEEVQRAEKRWIAKLTGQQDE
jgi:hypothetical protein